MWPFDEINRLKKEIMSKEVKINHLSKELEIKRIDNKELEIKRIDNKELEIKRIDNKELEYLRKAIKPYVAYEIRPDYHYITTVIYELESISSIKEKLAKSEIQVSVLESMLSKEEVDKSNNICFRIYNTLEDAKKNSDLR